MLHGESAFAVVHVMLPRAQYLQNSHPIRFGEVDLRFARPDLERDRVQTIVEGKPPRGINGYRKRIALRHQKRSGKRHEILVQTGLSRVVQTVVRRTGREDRALEGIVQRKRKLEV